MIRINSQFLGGSRSALFNFFLLGNAFLLCRSLTVDWGLFGSPWLKLYNPEVLEGMTKLSIKEHFTPILINKKLFFRTSSVRLTAEVGKPKWTGFSTISDTAASDWLNSAMLASDWFNSAMLRLIGPFRKNNLNCHWSRKLSLCHWPAQIFKQKKLRGSSLRKHNNILYFYYKPLLFRSKCDL